MHPPRGDVLAAGALTMKFKPLVMSRLTNHYLVSTCDQLKRRALQVESVTEIRMNALITREPEYVTREPEFGERWDVFGVVPQRTYSILDVGCGTGLGFQTLRRRGVRVVGVDFDAGCIEQARERLDEARVFNVEGDEWPVEWYGQFDTIAFNDCLEHLIDPWRVLANVHPLLSPDGVVVASIPNIRQWRLIVKLVLGRWDYNIGMGTQQREHVRFFTRKTIEDLAR
jgi:2-polyprenyl-3-methyl-5-hydroxy-6-metoxy-1,4-benzoquinol methylase